MRAASSDSGDVGRLGLAEQSQHEPVDRRDDPTDPCRCGVSDATMNATARMPRPTSTAITTTVRNVPSIGASDTSRPIAATTGSTSLIPMLKTLPAATASVASVGEYPQAMNILRRNGRSLGPGMTDGHSGWSEIGDHAATHRQARHERCGEETLRRDPDHPHREQGDEIGVLERGDRLDDRVGVEVLERRDAGCSRR